MELIAGGPAELRRGFGSDNQSGVHPAVLEALVAANVGHAGAYGDDPWTVAAQEVLASRFGAECTVAMVFNGTGANVVGLSAALDPWSSVICATTAHINTDECGAIEHVIGAKLVSVETPDGKLTPELVAPLAIGFGNEHHREPKVVSISNLTELGTLYTPEEVLALADFAHERGMLLHMDGARLPNAAVALGCEIAEFTGRAGVDVLSFGGTKNGMLGGEAVVLSSRVASERILYLRKQNLQLASKQRFVSAQFIGMFGGDVWRECAENANTMAQRLVAGATAAGVRLQYPAPGNEVFALLPNEVIAGLQERFRFYDWMRDVEPGSSSVRWVCSFDTTTDDVDALVDALENL